MFTNIIIIIFEYYFSFDVIQIRDINEGKRGEERRGEEKRRREEKRREEERRGRGEEEKRREEKREKKCMGVIHNY